MTTIHVLPRTPGEPVPDLRDYRVVHRAMTVDLQRLARAAADLVDRPDPARMAALRHYLRVVSAEIESHHHVEDEAVWPFLVAVAADVTALVALTEDHDQLDPLLHRANALAAREVADPELVGVLREVADLLTRHIAAEERDIFPIIIDRVRVQDYERLQKRFRGNLKPALLPFLVPWVLRHASPEDRAELLAKAGWPMRRGSGRASSCCSTGSRRAPAGWSGACSGSTGCTSRSSAAPVGASATGGSARARRGPRESYISTLRVGRLARRNDQHAVSERATRRPGGQTDVPAPDSWASRAIEASGMGAQAGRLRVSYSSS